MQPLQGAASASFGHAAGFGPAAGPPRFGAPARQLPIMFQPQAGVVPQAQFAATYAFQVGQPSGGAPAHRKPKKKGRRKPPATSAPAAAAQQQLAVNSATPFQSEHVPPFAASADILTDSHTVMTGAVQKGKKERLWCHKCGVDTHLSKDCTAVHYCYICNSYKHRLVRCPVLKKPRPTVSFCGQGNNSTMFIQLPHNVYRENASSSATPTALVTISGGVLTATAVETEVAKLARVQGEGRWEAVLHGDNQFLISFPSMDDLNRVADVEFRIRSHGVTISFSEWKDDDIPSYFGLDSVWVPHGVPHGLRNFLGLWAIGSVIGSTLDVDLTCLRRKGIVRIQVAVVNKDIFKQNDSDSNEPFDTDIYVKLKGFALRFELEKDDFVAEPEFVPLIWKKHDHSPDPGHDDDDEHMSDGDNAKRTKKRNANAVTPTGQATSSDVPMHTATALQPSSLAVAQLVADSTSSMRLSELPQSTRSSNLHGETATGFSSPPSSPPRRQPQLCTAAAPRTQAPLRQATQQQPRSVLVSPEPDVHACMESASLTLLQPTCMHARMCLHLSARVGSCSMQQQPVRLGTPRRPFLPT